MSDDFERTAMKIAGNGFLLVSFAAFVYIFFRAPFRVTLASVIMLGSFIAYCCIMDEVMDDDDY